MSFSGYSSSQ